MSHTVGFIGLGLMGRPMAKNLLKAGFPLVVHSRSQGPVDDLVAAGAQKATSPADVARRATRIITMVPDSPDVELVLEGPDGVFSAFQPGTIVIDMSSIVPAVAMRLAKKAESLGGWMLDAPVSGGEIGAISGTLSVMVGGNEKAFDEVRRIFAEAPLARERKYTASTFSFNIAGGRCETCEGAGYQEVEMVFMADLFLPCEECEGRRFKADVLDVKVNGKSIVEVLDLSVDEAIRFFPREEKLGQALWHLQQVGLGYLRLGQSATTLSGGEAQRVKIARELIASARGKGRKLYVMDEPTTGLHLEDIRKLMQVLDRLVEAGHGVLLIEHNLDVIALADWVVDLGPDGGDGGGRIVAEGTPEQVAAVEASHTGRWLKPLLARSAPVKARGATTRAGSRR